MPHQAHILRVLIASPGDVKAEREAIEARAGLVTAVAAGVDGGLLDEHIAYVTSDAAFHSPFAHGYQVLEVLPYRAPAKEVVVEEAPAVPAPETVEATTEVEETAS